jgi:hypothetical protein
MSENKGKAKVKSTAKSVGKNKAAVMNTRNPKKPEAISGDTMSNYAMYKKGGMTSKAKKFAALAPPYNKITAADRIAGAKKNSRKK